MRHRLLFATGLLTILVCFAGSAGVARCQQTDSGARPADANASSATTIPDAPVAAGQSSAREGAQAATDASSTTDLNGTVTDVNGDLVPGATVVLEGATPADHQSQVANDNGFFNFPGLKAGVPYRLTISAKGFENWVSPPITLAAGQFYGVSDVKLKLAGDVSSVTVYSSTEQIATQQVELEEQQRILGFIPNFYVVYDSKNAVPLTTKLKVQMAYRVAIDPVSFVGAAALAGMNQGGDDLNYPLGARRIRRALWRGLCRWSHGHHVRWRDSPITSAPGSAVFLSRDGLGEVALSSRASESVYLPRRQRQAATELLEHRREI